MNDVKIYIESILIPVVIGFIIGLITNNSIDYTIKNTSSRLDISSSMYYGFIY